MKYLVYMSTAVHLFNDAELKQILQTSHTNNHKADLTGILLYSGGTFIQLLEGDAVQLGITYKKIEKDPRHKHIILLADGEVDERMFPGWSMGFKTISTDEFSKLDAFINLQQSDFRKKDENHPAIAILKVFAETNNL